MFEQLSGWNLIAHDEIVDQETTEPWDGRRLVLPAHVHAHSDGDLELEVLINERAHDEWVLSAEPPIVVPISNATALSAWGIPTVVPEILLFYKGTAYFGDAEMTKRRSHDDVDFETLRNRLDRDERTWPQDSISRLYPNHSCPTTRGWNGRRTRTGTSLRPRSGHRDRRRPSDAAGGA